MLKRILSYLLIFSLLLVLVGCGGNSSDTGTKDEEQDAEEVVETVEGDKEETKEEDYTVGSTFEADGVTATLNSVTVSAGNEYSTPQEGYEYILSNWTVANNTDEDFNPFEFSVSMYVDGTAVESAITALPDQFDNATMLIPDTNSTGNKVFEVPQGWQEIQLRVRIGTVDPKTAIFKVTADQVTQ